MISRCMMWVIWPAFLMAGLMEVLVFAMVDQQDLHWFGQPVALSAQAVYTLAFFAFWVITMLASAMTVFLISSPVGCKPWSSTAQNKA